jgi:hypothetical protein
MEGFLKKTSLVALLSCPTTLFAQSALESSLFSPRLKLQTRFDLSDSYRKNALDAFALTGRFGIKYKYKNIFADFESQAGAASSAYVSGTTASTDNGTQNLFVVRRANVGLNLVQSDHLTFSFILGRDHLSGANVYGPDALSELVTTVIGNAPASTNEDGVTLKYTGKFDFGSLSLLGGHYNNVPVLVQSGGTTPFSNSAIGQKDNIFGSAPKTQSRAFVVSLAGDIKIEEGVLETRAFYSAQPNAVTSVVTVASPASVTYEARDIKNMEFSLGYNYNVGALKAGAWYQSVFLGDTQTADATAIKTNNYAFADKSATTDDSDTITTYGVGVAGNSKLFGFSGFIEEGDAFTYGLTYQNASGQNYTIGTDSLSVKNTLTALALGYQQGPFGLEMNYAMLASDQKIYADNQGKANASSRANILYLVATVVL